MRCTKQVAGFSRHSQLPDLWTFPPACTPHTQRPHPPLFRSSVIRPLCGAATRRPLTAVNSQRVPGCDINQMLPVSCLSAIAIRPAAADQPS